MKIGDPIFYQPGRAGNLSSKLINVGTYAWPRTGFSHVGVLGALHGDFLLYESLASCTLPCVRSGYCVEGVQAHYLDDILMQGGGTYYVCPLRRELYRHEIDRLLWFLDSVVGRPYDKIGAARSGGFIFRNLQKLLRPENTNTFFCSELVVAALVSIGIFQTRSVSGWNPNSLYRELRRLGIIDRPRPLTPPPAMLEKAA